MLDLNLGITSGTATLTSAFNAQSAWTVDTIGKAGQTTSLTITGTGDVDASAGSIVLSGTSVSFNASGLTDADGLSVTAAAVTVASTISGSSGADVIVGSAGADVLTGGVGADNITGGVGADTITGGTGPDIIVIGATHSGITVATADRVVGFVTNEDNLVLGAAGDLVNDAQVDTENYTEAGAVVADFAAALAAANVALTAMKVTEINAAKLYNLQWDATNGYLFIDGNADGAADMVVVLPGITGGTFGPDDIDP
jgi:Ca2+-binding RTX toxin-like protein